MPYPEAGAALLITAGWYKLAARVDVDLGPRPGTDLPGQRLGGLAQADIMTSTRRAGSTRPSA